MTERSPHYAIPLPLSPHVWGSLAAPFPLTSAEWDQLMATLAAMRPALVTLAPPPATADASEETGRQDAD